MNSLLTNQKTLSTMPQLRVIIHKMREGVLMSPLEVGLGSGPVTEADLSDLDMATLGTFSEICQCSLLNYWEDTHISSQKKLFDEVGLSCYTGVHLILHPLSVSN